MMSIKLIGSQTSDVRRTGEANDTSSNLDAEIPSDTEMQVSSVSKAHRTHDR